MTLYFEHVIIKGLLISLIVWGYTLLVIYYNPFDQKKLNDLEITNMILCGMAIFIGMLLYASQIEEINYALNTLSIILLAVIIIYAGVNISNIAKTYLEKY